MICWICGKETEAVYKTDYDLSGGKTGWRKGGKKDGHDVRLTKYRAYCPECQEKRNEELKADREKYVILKKKLMYERAMELMEKQGCDMLKYRNAAIKVQRYLYANFDKFDSADEVIAAIVLLHNGLQIKMQYKVGSYQVDILIPDKKIALEIDGDRHKYSRDSDSFRDVEIKAALGEGWEVVRIGTHHLEKNCGKLIAAIDALKDYKQAVNN